MIAVGLKEKMTEKMFKIAKTEHRPGPFMLGW